MKVVWKTVAAVSFALAVPADVMAGGPQQSPMQAPANTPSKALNTAPGAPAYAQSNSRRAYSYDPAAPVAVRTYANQPVRTNAIRSYSYNPSDVQDYRGVPSYMVPKALRRGFDGQ